MKPIIQGALDALEARIRALEVLPARVISVVSALASLTTLVGTGRLWVNRQILTGSGVYTPTPGTKRILVRMIGGGGAGGGANNITAPTTAGAGGNSGWYLEFRVGGSSNVAGGAFSCGAGAVGSGGAGATGADTTFTANDTVFIAKGGTGGDSLTNLNAEPLAAAGGSTSVGIDFACYGPGGAGIPTGGQISYSGFGGSVAPFGSGGFAVFFGATASPGLGFGSGGSGATSTSTALGGSGAPGCIVVDEFV